MRRRLFCAAIAAGATGVARPGWPATDSARVAAASDLKFALAALADEYRRETGQHVQLTFGSSGQFAQQIRQGLPVDLYMAADEQFVEQLADAGFTQDAGALYALGRIAVLAGASSSIALDPALQGLRAGWAQVRHFSIANPEHAPYGRAARQALERLGLWESVQAKLVLGENIAQATQFVTTGAAQAGVTALSLALAPEVARQARHVLLPATLHDPLRQRMVLLRNSRPAAQDFYRFLQGPSARAVFARFGFSRG